MTGGETSRQQQITNSEVGPLVFILHKKLCKTDVCSKRKEILLPNRDAKRHLPSLMVPGHNNTTLPVQDLKTGQIWSFKYKTSSSAVLSLVSKTVGTALDSGQGAVDHIFSARQFVDHHKLEAGDMIRLYKRLPDNNLVIEAVKLGEASREPTVPPTTTARRAAQAQAPRIRRPVRKSPTNEALPPGFI